MNQNSRKSLKLRGGCGIVRILSGTNQYTNSFFLWLFNILIDTYYGLSATISLDGLVFGLPDSDHVVLRFFYFVRLFTVRRLCYA